MNFARTINFSILIAFLFITSLFSYSQEDSSKKAEGILAKASEAVAKMTFKSRSIQKTVGVQKNITTNIYQKSNPDGTVWIKVESIKENEKKENEVISVFLQNDEGMFFIAGKIAVKLAYMNTLQNNMMNNMGQVPLAVNGNSVKYSLVEKEHNGIPCYVVDVKTTNTIETDKEILEATKKSLPDDIKKILDEQNINLSAMMPSVVVYYIGKNDNFVYSMRNYNSKGKLISQINYENVELNVKLDDNLFEIPKGLEVKVANSINEYSKYLSEAMLKDNESIKKEQKEKK
jgi:outer membrane lipoprotein-sorting protein